VRAVFIPFVLAYVYIVCCAIYNHRWLWVYMHRVSKPWGEAIEDLKEALNDPTEYERRNEKVRYWEEAADRFIKDGCKNVWSPVVWVKRWNWKP
jgi:hypothetical protein